MKKSLLAALSFLSLPCFLSCGAPLRPGESDALIVGGASNQILPAYLTLPSTCSGTKIGPRHILTAGHCVGAPDGKGGIQDFFPPETRLTVNADLGKSGKLSPLRLLVKHVHAHDSWSAALKKHQDPVKASWDEETSDIAIIEIKEDAAFERIATAEITSVPVEKDDVLKIGGIARLGDRSIHTASKKVSEAQKRAAFLPRTDSDGTSMSNVFTGDSGGAVYTANGKIGGIAVGGRGRAATDEDKAALSKILKAPSAEEEAALIKELVGYEVSLDELVQLMRSGEIKIVRIDSGSGSLAEWISGILR